jgi:hypothetical protein
VEDVVDADSVAACMRRMMTKQARWAGTATELLDAAAVGGDRYLAGRMALAKKPTRARRPIAQVPGISQDSRH